MSPLFATSVVAKVIVTVTVAAKNHIAKVTINARGLVTMVWYLKANFTAIKRSTLRDWSKSIGGVVGRSRQGVGHEVLSLVQGVGRTICGYP